MRVAYPSQGRGIVTSQCGYYLRVVVDGEETFPGENVDAATTAQDM